jgi:hypothetical protein
VKYFILILFILPLSALGQLKYKYKSKYESGIQLDLMGLSRGLAASYNRILFNGKYGFLSSSAGLSFVSGQRGKMFYKSGVGVPLALTYNHSLGELDKRIKRRLTSNCLIKPSKLDLEWFLEGGGGISPIFYRLEKEEINLTGYLGVRIQTVVSKPYMNNDLVIFIRGGYSPFYRITEKNQNEGKVNINKLILNPTQSGSLGFSLGIGF